LQDKRTREKGTTRKRKRKNEKKGAVISIDIER
jgi:hypothetical protein